MRKNLVAGILAVTLFLTSVNGAYASTQKEVIDRETVYTLLNYDGTVKKSIVVDWLHIKGEGVSSITDFGQLKNIKNISGSEKPVLKNGQIIWNTEVKGERSLYYSGETQKQLPVDVSINYYLNGHKVDALALAGQNGTVKITITLKNKLHQTKNISYAGYKGVNYLVKKDFYTPLLALVTINIPTEHFTDIKFKDAMTVMSGKTMNATWMVVPNPEETITLEMKGENIELEPITITLIPKLPLTPEVPVKEQLEKLTDGIYQISSALDQLAKGSQQLASGNHQVKNGLDQLSQGFEQLLKINQAQMNLVQQSMNTNNQALLLAQNLLAQNPQDANLQSLVQILQGQQQMLTLLAQGGELQGQAFPGLNKMGEGLKSAQVGVEQLATAADQLGKGALALKDGIEKLEGGTDEMKNGLIDGLNKLYEGEAVINQLKTAAEQYDTFLGKPQGAKGEVRFILKTDSIKSEQTKIPEEHKPVSSKEKTMTFFERVKKFFSSLF